MKKTGSGRFRQKIKLNTPQFDGIKCKMLCPKCETNLSKYENWFKSTVFDKILNDQSTLIENTVSLRKFCTSIVWRVLKYLKDDKNIYHFQKRLDEAEKEWSQFLLSDKPLSKYMNIHFILVDNSCFLDKFSELYFTREVDIEIAQSNTKCFIYAKFARFIIIGEIYGIDKTAFKNTNITEQLTFSCKNQDINDKDIIDFFKSRVEKIDIYNELSPHQQKNNDEYFKKYNATIKNSEYISIQKKYS